MIHVDLDLLIKSDAQLLQDNLDSALQLPEKVNEFIAGLGVVLISDSLFLLIFVVPLLLFNLSAVLASLVQCDKLVSVVVEYDSRIVMRFLLQFEGL